MSFNLTPQQQQQLESFILALLSADLRTISWSDLWNPTTLLNRDLNQDVFEYLTKQMKSVLKTILKGFRVRFDGNNITFLEGFRDTIPTIVSAFMRRVQLPVNCAVEKKHSGSVCGGGGGEAVAVSQKPPIPWGSEGWNLRPSDSCRGEGAGVQEHVPQTCSNAGGLCQFHNTWGRCKKIHPDHDPKKGDISTLYGRVIQLCRNGAKCPFGESCTFPHPANMSCVIESKTLKSGIRIDLARVCQFFLQRNCHNKFCKCAHVSQEVLDTAIERKNSAFEKRDSGKAVVSSRASSQRNADFDDSLQEANDEVAKLTGYLNRVSFREESHRNFSSTTERDVVFCGGGARARFLEKPSQEPCSGKTNSGNLFDILDNIFMEHQQPHSEQPVPPLPSAPLLERPSVGDWDELLDPKTGLSYYKNRISGEITMDNPREMISNACVAFACQALAEPCSASSVVACQALAEPCSASCALVRRRKVVQNDASVAPNASKRSCDSQSQQNCSKKGHH